MGKKAIEYNAENLQELEDSLRVLHSAQETMEACIERPEEMTFGDWQKAANNYRAALERVEALPKTLLSPEELEDPDDVKVTELLKERANQDPDESKQRRERG